MNLSFTIPYPFIEFMCHAVAAVFYIYSGNALRKPDDTLMVAIFLAIILTTVGANL